jgi:hypothetical protein
MRQNTLYPQNLVNIVMKHPGSAQSNHGGDSSRMLLEMVSQSPLKQQNPIFERSTGFVVASSHKRESAERQTREGQYLNSYKNSRSVLEKAPDLHNTLKSCRIDMRTRAKMVDWMFEVLYALQDSFSINTYIRSILIMDAYIKYNKDLLTNDAIHLIGVGSIYIASKYEDIYHIKINVLCEKAAHGKFNPVDIRRMENEILNVLGFSVSFSSFADIADHFIIRLLYAGSPGIMEEFRTVVLHFVALCVHDVKFNNISPHIFVVACLINAVKYSQSISLKKKEHFLSPDRVEQSIFQELGILKTIMELLDKCEKKELEEAIPVVREHLSNFEKKFTECRQVYAFAKFQKGMLN